MIGSGILVQPYVFRQAGIISVIFEYAVVGLLNFTGVDLLIRCAIKQSIFDYSTLTESILGRYGQLVVDTSIVVNNAGALLSYILIIGSVLENIISSFTTCSAWYCNIGFLTVTPIIVFTVPLCLIRNFGHLAIISYISILVIGGTILLVLIGGPIQQSLSGGDDSWNVGSFRGSIRTVGDIVFAMGFITAVFHAYNGMENKEIPVFHQVTITTIVSGVLMCFCTGLAGYLSFRGNTETNILENFPGSIGAVFKVALIIHLILYIPGDFVIMRAALLQLWDIDVATQSDRSFVLVTLSSIFFITGVAVMLQLYVNGESLGMVIDVTGGIAGSILYFVVPGLCGVKMFRSDLRIYLRSVGVGFFGISIMFFVILAISG